MLNDTGASDNFMNRRVADELQIEGLGSAEHISLATTKAEAKLMARPLLTLTFVASCIVKSSWE